MEGQYRSVFSSNGQYKSVHCSDNRYKSVRGSDGQHVLVNFDHYKSVYGSRGSILRPDDVIVSTECRGSVRGCKSQKVVRVSVVGGPV